MSWYRQQLEDWLKTIDVKAERVLDIGGSANPVKDRVGSWDVREYLVLDNEAEEQFCKNWRKPDFVHDMNTKFDCWMRGKVHYCGSFDVVFMLEVAEYLWRPLRALETIDWLLREGGIAYLSFPFVYPWHEPREHDYLRYTKRGIERLLSEAGFADWEIIERVDRSGKLVEFYRADGMHPTKGENHNVYGYLCTCFK